MSLPIVIEPPSAPHTHTVVFLHGRGDNAQKIRDSLWKSTSSTNQDLRSIFPSFRWVFPAAKHNPQRGWPEWFDIFDTSAFSKREEFQAEGLRESVTVIRRILESEAASVGWDHIVLAGISQGAATSVHTLLNLPFPLCAFIGFSCRMPFPGRSLEETKRILGLPNSGKFDPKTPVLLEHCADDPTVLIQDGRRLRGTLESFGMQVERVEYETGGHWFHSPKGIDDVVKFLVDKLKLKIRAY